MKHMRLSIFRFGLSLLGSAVIAIMCACAGGTRGTGGDSITGSVVTRSNIAVPGVKVTDLNTGAEDITDENGSFILESEISGGDLQLGIDSDTFSTTVVVPNVSATTTTVAVTLELDEENGSVELREVDEHEDDHDSEGRRTPTPRTSSDTPRPHGTSSPVPTPTGEPDDDATPVPTSATGTQVPTTAPTAAPSSTATPHEVEDTPHSEEGEDVEAEGSVQAITAANIVVRGKSFSITSETRFTSGSHAISRDQIHIGDKVHVYGTLQGGVSIATRVDKDD